MACFEVVIAALKEGRKVRREYWDETTVMFVHHTGILVQQRDPFHHPYLYDLSWHEIIAEDWSIN